MSDKREGNAASRPCSFQASACLSPQRNDLSIFLRLLHSCLSKHDLFRRTPSDFATTVRRATGWISFFSETDTRQLNLPFYQSHIGAMMSHLFDDGQDPFPRYRNYFNAHRIEQSGADDPTAGLFVNTAFGRELPL